MHIHLCSCESGAHSEEKDVHVKVHIWGMGYAGGIQTVVSAGNASLLLPVLLKSSLAVALFGAHALDISVP